MKKQSKAKLSKRKIELVSLLVGGTLVGASAAIPAVLELTKDNSALTDAQLKLKQDEMIQNILNKFNQMNQQDVEKYVHENVHSEKDIDKITKEVMALMSLARTHAPATLSPNSRNQRTSRQANVPSLSSSEVSAYIRSLLTTTQKIELDYLLGYTPAQVGLVWTPEELKSTREIDLIDKVKPLVITRLTTDVKAKCAPLVVSSMGSQTDIDAEIAKIVNIDNWNALDGIFDENKGSNTALVKELADQVSDVVSEKKIKYDIVVKFGLPHASEQEVNDSYELLCQKYPSLSLEADRELVDQLAGAEARLKQAEDERLRLQREHEAAVEEEKDFLAQLGEAQRIAGEISNIESQIDDFREAITALVDALNAVSDAQGKAEAQAIAQANFNEALAEAQRAVNNLNIDKLNNALNEQAQASQAYNDANANYQTALVAYQEIQKMAESAQAALDAAKALQTAWGSINSGAQTDLSALQLALEKAIDAQQTAVDADNLAKAAFDQAVADETGALNAKTAADTKAAETAEALRLANEELSAARSDLATKSQTFTEKQTDLNTKKATNDTNQAEKTRTQGLFESARTAWNNAVDAELAKLRDGLSLMSARAGDNLVRGDSGSNLGAESEVRNINWWLNNGGSSMGRQLSGTSNMDMNGFSVWTGSVISRPNSIAFRSWGFRANANNVLPWYYDNASHITELKNNLQARMDDDAIVTNNINALNSAINKLTAWKSNPPTVAEFSAFNVTLTGLNAAVWNNGISNWRDGDSMTHPQGRSFPAYTPSNFKTVLAPLIETYNTTKTAYDAAVAAATSSQGELNTAQAAFDVANREKQAAQTRYDSAVPDQQTKQAADDIAQADKTAKQDAYDAAHSARVSAEGVYNSAHAARIEADRIKDEIQEAFDTKNVSATVAGGMVQSLADAVARAQGVVDQITPAITVAEDRMNDAMQQMQTAKTAFEEIQSIVDAYFRDATGGATGHVGLQAQSFNNLGTLLDTLKFLGDDTTRDITSLTGNQLVGQINIDEINAALNDLEKLDAMLTSITLRTNSVLAEVTLAQFNVDKANSAAALARQANEAANAALQAANDATNKFLAALVATTGQQALFDEAKAAAQDALNKAIEAATLAKQADDQAGLALTSATRAHDNAVIEQTAKTDELDDAEQALTDAQTELTRLEGLLNTAKTEKDQADQALVTAQQGQDTAQVEYDAAVKAIEDAKALIQQQIDAKVQEASQYQDTINALQAQLGRTYTIDELTTKIGQLSSQQSQLPQLEADLAHNTALAGFTYNSDGRLASSSSMAGYRMNINGQMYTFPEGVTWEDWNQYTWGNTSRPGCAILAAANFPVLSSNENPASFGKIYNNMLITATHSNTARSEVSRLTPIVNDLRNYQKLVDLKAALVAIKPINDEIALLRQTLSYYSMTATQLQSVINGIPTQTQKDTVLSDLAHYKAIAGFTFDPAGRPNSQSSIAGYKININGQTYTFPAGTTWEDWNQYTWGASRPQLATAGFPVLNTNDNPATWGYIFNHNVITQATVTDARTNIARLEGVINSWPKADLSELQSIKSLIDTRDAKLSALNTAKQGVTTAQNNANTKNTNLANAQDAYDAQVSVVSQRQTERDAAQAAKDQADLEEASTQHTLDDATTNKQNTAAQKEAADDAQAAAQALYNDANLAATQAGWAAANANTARTNAQNSQNAAQDANTKAQAAMSAIEQQVKAAQAILDSVNAKNAALLELKDTITQLRDAAEGLVTSAQARYEADQAAIKAAQTALNSLLTTQGNAYTALLGLTLNTLEYDEFITRINDALVKATEELRLLNAELTRITTNGSVYQAAFNSLSDQKDDAEQELEDATEAAASANDALNAAKDGAEKAMADAYSPDATLRDAAADAAEAALASWAQAKAEAERINNLAQTAKTTAEQEFTTAQTKAGQTQTALDTATHNWEAAKTDLENKEQALVTAQQEKDQADEDLVTAQQEQDEAQAAYDEARRLWSESKSQVESQLSTLKQQYPTITNAKATITRLNGELGAHFSISQIDEMIALYEPYHNNIAQYQADLAHYSALERVRSSGSKQSTDLGGLRMTIDGTVYTFPSGVQGGEYAAYGRLGSWNPSETNADYIALHNAGFPQRADNQPGGWNTLWSLLDQNANNTAAGKIHEANNNIYAAHMYDKFVELKAATQISILEDTVALYSKTSAQIQAIIPNIKTDEEIGDLYAQLDTQIALKRCADTSINGGDISGMRFVIDGKTYVFPKGVQGAEYAGYGRLGSYNIAEGNSDYIALHFAGFPQRADSQSGGWDSLWGYINTNKGAAAGKISGLQTSVNNAVLVDATKVNEILALVTAVEGATTTLNTAKQTASTAQTNVNTKNQALQTATTNRDAAIIAESNKHADYDTAKAADDIADNDLASKTVARDRAVAYAAQTAQALSETTTAHSKAQAAATAARANANDAQVNAAHADAVRQTAEEALSTAEQAGSGAMQLQTDAANKLAAIMQQYNQAERRWNRVQRDIDQATNARDSKQAIVTMLTDIKTELIRLKALSHTPANSIDARIEEMQKFLMMYDGEYHSPEIDAAAAAHDQAVNNVQVTLNALNRANQEVTNAQNAINQLERDLRTKQDAYEQALKQEEEAKARLAILQQRINDADTRLQVAEAEKTRLEGLISQKEHDITTKTGEIDTLIQNISDEFDTYSQSQIGAINQKIAQFDTSLGRHYTLDEAEAELAQLVAQEEQLNTEISNLRILAQYFPSGQQDNYVIGGLVVTDPQGHSATLPAGITVRDWNRWNSNSHMDITQENWNKLDALGLTRIPAMFKTDPGYDPSVKFSLSWLRDNYCTAAGAQSANDEIATLQAQSQVDRILLLSQLVSFYKTDGSLYTIQESINIIKHGNLSDIATQIDFLTSLKQPINTEISNLRILAQYFPSGLQDGYVIGGLVVTDPQGNIATLPAGITVKDWNRWNSNNHMDITQENWNKLDALGLTRIPVMYSGDPGYDPNVKFSLSWLRDNYCTAAGAQSANDDIAALQAEIQYIDELISSLHDLIQKITTKTTIEKELEEFKTKRDAAIVEITRLAADKSTLTTLSGDATNGLTALQTAVTNAHTRTQTAQNELEDAKDALQAGIELVNTKIDAANTARGAYINSVAEARITQIEFGQAVAEFIVANEDTLTTTMHDRVTETTSNLDANITETEDAYDVYQDLSNDVYVLGVQALVEQAIRYAKDIDLLSELTAGTYSETSVINNIYNNIVANAVINYIVTPDLLANPDDSSSMLDVTKGVPVKDASGVLTGEGWFIDGAANPTEAVISQLPGLLAAHPYTDWTNVDTWIASLVGNEPDADAGTWTQSASAGLVWSKQPLEITGEDFKKAWDKLLADIQGDIEIMGGTDGTDTFVGLGLTEQDITDYMTLLLDKDLDDAVVVMPDGSHTYTSAEARSLNASAIATLIKDANDDTQVYFTAHRAEILTFLASVVAYKETVKTNVNLVDDKGTTDVSDDVTTHGFERLTNPANHFFTVDENNDVVDTTGMTLTGTPAATDLADKIEEFETTYNALVEVAGDLKTLQDELLALQQAATIDQDAVDAKTAELDLATKALDTARVAYIKALNEMFNARGRIDSSGDLDDFKELLLTVQIADSIMKSFNEYKELNDATTGLAPEAGSDTPTNVSEFITKYFETLEYLGEDSAIVFVDVTDPLAPVRNILTDDEITSMASIVKQGNRLEETLAKYKTLGQQLPAGIFSFTIPTTVEEFIAMYKLAIVGQTVAHPITDWLEPLTEDQQDEMVEMVSEYVINQIKFELTGFVLDIFALPHDDATELAASIAKLENKFTTDDAHDVVGAEAAIQSFLEAMMWTVTTAADGTVTVDATTVDWNKLAALTTAKVQAAARTAGIDMVLTTVSSNSIITENHELLSTDNPGKVWYPLGTIREQLEGHNFPASPLGDYGAINIPSIFDATLADVDGDGATADPFTDFDSQIDQFISTMVGLGPDDDNNVENPDHADADNHGIVWREQQMKITQDQIESVMTYLLAKIKAESYVSDVDTISTDSIDITDAEIEDYINDLLDKNTDENHVIVLQDYEPADANAKLEMIILTNILKDVNDGTDVWYDAHKDEIRQEILTREARQYANSIKNDFATGAMTVDQIIAAATSATTNIVTIVNNAPVTSHGNPALLTSGKFDSVANLLAFKAITEKMLISAALDSTFAQFEALHLHLPSNGISTTIPTTVSEFVTRYFEAVAYSGTTVTSINLASASARTEMVTKVKEYIITQVENEILDEFLAYFHLANGNDDRDTSLTTLNTKFDTAQDVIDEYVSQIEGWVLRGWTVPTGDTAYLAAAYTGTGVTLEVDLTALSRLVAINIVSAFISANISDADGINGKLPGVVVPVGNQSGVWVLPASVFDQLNGGSSYLDWTGLTGDQSALWTAYTNLAIAQAALAAGTGSQAAVDAAWAVVYQGRVKHTETSVWDAHYSTFTSWNQIDTFIDKLTGTGWDVTSADYTGIAWSIEPAGFTREDIQGVYDLLFETFKANADIQAMLTFGITNYIWADQTAADNFLKEFVDNLIDKNANAKLQVRDYGISESQTLLNAGLVARVLLDYNLKVADAAVAGAGTPTQDQLDEQTKAFNAWDKMSATGQQITSHNAQTPNKLEHVEFYNDEAITYLATELAKLYATSLGLDFTEITTTTNTFVQITNNAPANLAGFDLTTIGGAGDTKITNKAEFDLFVTFANKVAMYESIVDSFDKFKALNLFIPTAYTTNIPTTVTEYLEMYFDAISRNLGTSTAITANTFDHVLTTAEQETMRDIVRAELVAQVSDEMEKLILTEFNLPHNTPNEVSSSINTLELKYQQAMSRIPGAWNQPGFTPTVPTAVDSTHHYVQDIIDAEIAKWAGVPTAQVDNHFDFDALVDQAAIEIVATLIQGQQQYQDWDGMRVPNRGDRLYAPAGSTNSEANDGNRDAIISQLVSTSTQQGLYAQMHGTFTTAAGLDAFVTALLGSGPLPSTTPSGLRWREYNNAITQPKVQAAFDYMVQEVKAIRDEANSPLPSGVTDEEIQACVKTLFDRDGDFSIQAYNAAQAKTMHVDLNAIMEAFDNSEFFKNAPADPSAHSFVTAHRQEIIAYFWTQDALEYCLSKVAPSKTWATATAQEKAAAQALYNRGVNPSLGMATINPTRNGVTTVEGIDPLMVVKVVSPAEFDDATGAQIKAAVTENVPYIENAAMLNLFKQAVDQILVADKLDAIYAEFKTRALQMPPEIALAEVLPSTTTEFMNMYFRGIRSGTPDVVTDWTIDITARYTQIGDVVLAVAKQDAIEAVTGEIMKMFGMSFTSGTFVAQRTVFFTKFPRAEALIQAEALKLFDAATQTKIRAGQFDYPAFLRNIFIKIVAAKVETMPIVSNSIGIPTVADPGMGYFVRDSVLSQMTQVLTPSFISSNFANWNNIDNTLDRLAGQGPLVNPNGNPGIIWTTQPLSVTSAELKAAFNLLVQQISTDPEIIAMGIDRQTIINYVDNLFDKNAPTTLNQNKDYGPSETSVLNMGAIYQLKTDAANGTHNYYDSHRDDIITLFATNAAKAYATAHGVNFNDAANPAYRTAGVDFATWSKIPVAGVGGIAEVGADGRPTGNRVINSAKLLAEFKTAVDLISGALSFEQAYAAYMAMGQYIPDSVKTDLFGADVPNNADEFVELFLSGMTKAQATAVGGPLAGWTGGQLTTAQINALAQEVKEMVDARLELNIKSHVMQIFKVQDSNLWASAQSINDGWDAFLQQAFAPDDPSISTQVAASETLIDNVEAWIDLMVKAFTPNPITPTNTNDGYLAYKDLMGEMYIDYFTPLRDGSMTMDQVYLEAAMHLMEEKVKTVPNYMEGADRPEEPGFAYFAIMGVFHQIRGVSGAENVIEQGVAIPSLWNRYYQSVFVAEASKPAGIFVAMDKFAEAIYGQGPDMTKGSRDTQPVRSGLRWSVLPRELKSSQIKMAFDKLVKDIEAIPDIQTLGVTHAEVETYVTMLFTNINRETDASSSQHYTIDFSHPEYVYLTSEVFRKLQPGNIFPPLQSMDNGGRTVSTTWERDPSRNPLNAQGQPTDPTRPVNQNGDMYNKAIAYFATQRATARINPADRDIIMNPHNHFVTLGNVNPNFDPAHPTIVQGRPGMSGVVVNGLTPGSSSIYGPEYSVSSAAMFNDFMQVNYALQVHRSLEWAFNYFNHYIDGTAWDANNDGRIDPANPVESPTAHPINHMWDHGHDRPTTVDEFVDLYFTEVYPQIDHIEFVWSNANHAYQPISRVNGQIMAERVWQIINMPDFAYLGNNYVGAMGLPTSIVFGADNIAGTLDDPKDAPWAGEGKFTVTEDQVIDYMIEAAIKEINKNGGMIDQKIAEASNALRTSGFLVGNTLTQLADESSELRNELVELIRVDLKSRIGNLSRGATHKYPRSQQDVISIIETHVIEVMLGDSFYNDIVQRYEEHANSITNGHNLLWDIDVTAADARAVSAARVAELQKEYIPGSNSFGTMVVKIVTEQDFFSVDLLWDKYDEEFTSAFNQLPSDSTGRSRLEWKDVTLYFANKVSDASIDQLDQRIADYLKDERGSRTDLPSLDEMYTHIYDLIIEITRAANDEFTKFNALMASMGGNPSQGLRADIDHLGTTVAPVGNSGETSPVTYDELMQLENKMGNYVVESAMQADHGQINDDTWHNAFLALISSTEGFSATRDFLRSNPQHYNNWMGPDGQDQTMFGFTPTAQQEDQFLERVGEHTYVSHSSAPQGSRSSLTGEEVAYSTTMYIGFNLLRFDYKLDANNNRVLSGVSIVAQDRDYPEVVTDVQLSEDYSLDNFSIELSIRNATDDLISISSHRTGDDITVVFTRISRRTPSGQPDYRWVSSERTIIYGGFLGGDNGTPNDPSDDMGYATIEREDQAALDGHSAAHESPYAEFINRQPINFGQIWTSIQYGNLPAIRRASENFDDLYSLAATASQSAKLPTTPVWGDPIQVTTSVDDEKQTLTINENDKIKTISNGQANFDVHAVKLNVPVEKESWLWIFLMSMSIAITFGMGWLIFMHYRKKKKALIDPLEEEISEKSFDEMKAEIAEEVKAEVAAKLGIKHHYDEENLIKKEDLPMSKMKTQEVVMTPTSTIRTTTQTTELRNKNIKIGIVNMPKYEEELPTIKNSTSFGEVKVAPKKTTTKKPASKTTTKSSSKKTTK